MIRILHELPVLSRSAPQISTHILPKLAFLPTNYTTALQQQQQQQSGSASASSSSSSAAAPPIYLYAPAQLFDPTSPDLAALLDSDTCFPSSAFTSNPRLLPVLRSLGLRTALDARGALSSVHSIVAASVSVGAVTAAVESSASAVAQSNPSSSLSSSASTSKTASGASSNFSAKLLSMAAASNAVTASSAALAKSRPSPASPTSASADMSVNSTHLARTVFAQARVR
jgi:hypothetical protein